MNVYFFGCWDVPGHYLYTSRHGVNWSDEHHFPELWARITEGTTP